MLHYKLKIRQKIAKNRLSAGLRSNPLGNYSATPDPIAGLRGKGEEEGKKGKETRKGRGGIGRKGQRRGGGDG